LLYATLIWLCFFTFVVFYEEPSLQRRFGDSYAAYRSSVPRWWPRITPWQPHELGGGGDGEPVA
jgi:protein-S-isoprenylcysteine O-methyltransferase Ste14